MGDGYEKVCIRSGVDMKKLIYLKYMCVFVDVNIHEQENTWYGNQIGINFFFLE